MKRHMIRSNVMRKTIRWTVLTSLVIALTVTSAAPAAAAKAPVGKTYFVVSVGVASDAAEAYELDYGCVRFTPTLFCQESRCGEWERTADGRQTSREWPMAFHWTIVDDETGAAVEIDGKGRIDSRGPKSSISAVARGRDPETGVAINFAFAGRAVGAARCERLVTEYLAGNR
jgi:hypothetical protein